MSQQQYGSPQQQQVQQQRKQQKKQRKMLQHRQVWQTSDPVTLCQEVRTRAYQAPEIANRPELIAPLDELVTRFEQSLRAAGVGTTTQPLSAGISQQGISQQSF